jgi:hypothetical protein
MLYTLSRMITAGLANGPRLTTRECVGIVVSITGNVLISLSLNLQKLAHRRLELGPDDEIEDGNGAAGRDDETLRGSNQDEVGPSETEPLLPLHTIRAHHAEDPALADGRKPMRLRLPSWRVLYRSQSMDDAQTDSRAHIMITPPTPITETEETPESSKRSSSPESGYLSSKLWFVLDVPLLYVNAEDLFVGGLDSCS